MAKKKKAKSVSVEPKEIDLGSLLQGDVSPELGCKAEPGQVDKNKGKAKSPTRYAKFGS